MIKQWARREGHANEILKDGDDTGSDNMSGPAMDAKPSARFASELFDKLEQLEG
jgi:hypothetical protein